MQFALWQIAPGKFLPRRQLALVLADRNRRAERSANGRFNLVLFRLACCGGLRVSEIAKLRLDDVDVTSPRPTIRVRRNVGKGGRGRWYRSGGTRAHWPNLVAWKWRLAAAVDATARGS